MYCKRKPPSVQERFTRPIKQIIEESPSFGYRIVAHLLKFKKSTVQRVFQLMRWQVRKAAPRLQGAGSSAATGGERTERALGDGPMQGVQRPRWLGGSRSRHRLLHPRAAVWHLSRSSRSRTAKAALESLVIIIIIIAHRADRALRRARTRTNAALASLGLWRGLHQSQLCPAGARLCGFDVTIALGVTPDPATISDHQPPTRPGDNSPRIMDDWTQESCRLRWPIPG
jgi:hypothetical protein